MTHQPTLEKMKRASLRNLRRCLSRKVLLLFFKRKDRWNSLERHVLGSDHHFLSFAPRRMQTDTTRVTPFNADPVLVDPQWHSRLLYANPVCLLTSISHTEPVRQNVRCTALPESIELHHDTS